MLISRGCSLCGTKSFEVDESTRFLSCTSCDLLHSSYGHFVEYQFLTVQFNGPQGTFIHIGSLDIDMDMDMDIERGIRVEGVTKTQLLKALDDLEDLIEAQNLKPPEEDWDGLSIISTPGPINWSD